MVIKSMSLVDPVQSKSVYLKVEKSSLFRRYTEIWSLDGQSKNIKLADPQLTDYCYYPELLLVDTTFCVKP